MVDLLKNKTMEKYSEYKDSGVEWLGNIPKGWEIKRAKLVFNRRMIKNRSDNPVVLSLARSGVKVRDISTNEGQLAESYLNYNVVEPGDILLNPMDLISGANCSLSKVYGVISPAYINFRPKYDYSSGYFDYYFKLQYWSNAFFVHGKGVSIDNRWTLNSHTILNYPTLVPDSDTQQRIAEYLDEKTATIDATVEKKKQLIKLLEEKRASLINHAVTKGLDPSAELIDSSIDWIGKIPKGWEVLKLKYILINNDGGVWGEDDPLGEGIIVLRSTEVNERGDWRISNPATRRLSQAEFLSAKLKDGDLLLTKSSGSRVHLGKVALVTQKIENQDIAYSNFMQRIRLSKRRALPHFFFYLMNNVVVKDQIDYLGLTTSGIINLNASLINQFWVVLPPIQEQEKIVTHLNVRASEFDQAIKKTKTSIKLLQEYRSSLISNVVTGKIKI